MIFTTHINLSVVDPISAHSGKQITHMHTLMNAPPHAHTLTHVLPVR